MLKSINVKHIFITNSFSLTKNRKNVQVQKIQNTNCLNLKYHESSYLTSNSLSESTNLSFQDQKIYSRQLNLILGKTNFTEI